MTRCCSRCATPLTRFPIPVEAFGELIDGCEADVRGVSYATFDELKHYCRCVAGSIGRLSLGVFGSTDLARADELADSLGLAMQLVNIIRDIREDLGNGRVYLPAEDLERFGCTLEPGAGPDGGAARRGVMAGPLDELIRFEAERARQWYSIGLRLLPMLDRRSARLHRRDGRYLPAAARPHQRRAPTRRSTTGCRCRPARRRWSRRARWPE